MKRMILASSALFTIAALSGCGAVNNAINNAIPEISNMTGLDSATLDATLGSGRALISGNVSKTVSFADRSLPQQGSLKHLKLRQSLHQTVQVTMPGSTAFPASFQLSNITLQITLADGSGGSLRTVSASSTVAGPITFTRQGSSNNYNATVPIEVSNINFDNASFNSVRDIITTAPDPNSATGKLSFDADDTQLPSGTVLRFTFINGAARVAL